MHNSFTITIGQKPNYKILDTQPKLKKPSSPWSISGFNIYNTDCDKDLKRYSKDKQVWLLKHFPRFFLDCQLGDRLINSDQGITKNDLDEINEKCGLSKFYEVPGGIILDQLDFLNPKDIYQLLPANKAIFEIAKGHSKMRKVYELSKLKHQIKNKLGKSCMDQVIYHSFIDPNFKHSITVVEKLFEKASADKTKDLNQVQKEAIKLLDLSVDQVKGLISAYHLQAVYGLGFDKSEIEKLDRIQAQYLVADGLNLSDVIGKSFNELIKIEFTTKKTFTYLGISLSLILFSLLIIIDKNHSNPLLKLVMKLFNKEFYTSDELINKVSDYAGDRIMMIIIMKPLIDEYVSLINKLDSLSSFCFQSALIPLAWSIWLVLKEFYIKPCNRPAKVISYLTNPVWTLKDN